MSITRFQSHFIANWRFGILALLFCLFFIRLGFWQLARADEKEQLLATQHQQATQAPIDWQSGSVPPTQYQPIHVRGHFMPVTLLLDNQHYQHQFGYDVLTPLVVEKGKVVLIDRGFVPANSNREMLPSITTPTGEMEVVGSAYFPSDKNWALGNIFDSKQTSLAVIELVDARIVGQFLHKSVYPFIIRLRPDAAHGFVRDWPVVAMSPSRHFAYAVQWFAMALVILMLYVMLNIKKKS